MSGNAYLYRMPAGIPGAISRTQDLTSEPVLLSNAHPFLRTITLSDGSTTTVTAYGVPGKYDTSDDGQFVPLVDGDTADVVVGWLIRPYPSTSIRDFQHQINTGVVQEGDNMKRGYMTVNVGEDATSIKRGSPVFFDPTSQKVLLESEKDSEGNNTALTIPTAVFNGPGDADGNVEIAYNI